MVDASKGSLVSAGVEPWGCAQKVPLSLQPLPVEFLSRGLAWRARCNRTLGSDGVPSLCAAHVGATGHPWLLGLGSVAGGTEEVEF